ncbi:MAG TPA: DNA-3-methyladenine glycosylase [Gammaproteobacteria bacterium]
MQLSQHDFNCDAARLAQKLLGKVIRHRYRGHWLAARIIETEAYYLHDRASHASLGYTDKRRALFMPAGTIYMYYARGKDSLNISAQGEGNAVLIKSAVYYQDTHCDAHALQIMQQLNPASSGEMRPVEKLCSGQTLLCRALGIRLSDWDQQQFCQSDFYIDDVGYRPASIIQTSRLGITAGRDEDLLLRFIDEAEADYCTKNPLRQRRPNYQRITSGDTTSASDETP